MTQLVYQVYFTKYHVSFYLCLIGIVKFQNIMNKIVCKSSFWSLHSKPWLEFQKKMFIFFQKVSSVKKLPITDSESFLESIFDLNWTCKILLTQNRSIWNFNATDLLYIFLKDLGNHLIKYKMSNNWCLKRTGQSED